MDKSTFLSKYGTDHIIAYLGIETQVRMSPKPVAPGRMAKADASALYIDEMNYGSINRPVSIFEVDPGLHKVELCVGYKNGRNMEQYTSEPRPVRVKETSKLLVYRMVKCLSGAYFSIEEYEDFDSFLKSTGMSWSELLNEF